MQNGMHHQSAASCLLFFHKICSRLSAQLLYKIFYFLRLPRRSKFAAPFLDTGLTTALT